MLCYWGTHHWHLCPLSVQITKGETLPWCRVTSKLESGFIRFFCVGWQKWYEHSDVELDCQHTLTICVCICQRESTWCVSVWGRWGWEGVCVSGWGRMCVCMHLYVWARETEERVGGIASSNIGKRNIVCWKGNRLLRPLHNSLLMEQEGMRVSFEFSVYHFMQVYTLSLLCMLFKTVRETNKWMWVCSLCCKQLWVWQLCNGCNVHTCVKR